MFYNYNNLTIDRYKGPNKSKIEGKLILLEAQRLNLKDISNQNNHVPYYSNVIKRQNTHSPNHSILLHNFVDDKKITYKDITNKIDINELNSKIKKIVVNIQRIKSSDKLETKKYCKPKVYHRKTKSCYSYRQSNSSFTTENESRNSCYIKNIYIKKNNHNNNQIYNDNILVNLNVNNFLNNNNKSIKHFENKTFDNDKYYNQSLKEYLNEQINSIRCKRSQINEANLNNNNNEINHNYSIDNENKDLLDSQKDININSIDNSLIIPNTKNKKPLNEDGLVFSGNKSKNNKTILKNEEEKVSINFSKTNSNFEYYKKNNLITRDSKKKVTNKTNNTFRNSHINLNITKHNTFRIMNKNLVNHKIKSQYADFCKLKNNLLPKPLKVTKNVNKSNKNIKKSKSFLNMLNTYNNNNNNRQENITSYREYKNNNIIHKKLTNDLFIKDNESKKSINDEKRNWNKKFEFKEKRNKKKKNYSEIIRNKIQSESQKKLKVKVKKNKNKY